MLDNIFSPLFAVSLDPSSNPPLHYFLGTFLCTVLYCTVLYCTVLYCTVLWCIQVYCTILHWGVPYCDVTYCIVQHCTPPYHTSMIELSLPTPLSSTILLLHLPLLLTHSEHNRNVDTYIPPQSRLIPSSLHPCFYPPPVPSHPYLPPFIYLASLLSSYALSTRLLLRSYLLPSSFPLHLPPRLDFLPPSPLTSSLLTLSLLFPPLSSLFPPLPSSLLSLSSSTLLAATIVGLDSVDDESRPERSHLSGGAAGGSTV